MERIPKISLNKQTIEAVRLPPSSYRPNGCIYGTFMPFDLRNDFDIWGNNQLNWISLYLINKFGIETKSINQINSDKILSIETLNEETIKEIKKLGEQMTEEYNQIKRKIEEFKTPKEFQEIKDLINNIKSPNLEQTIINLENRIKNIENMVVKIGEKFGIAGNITA